MAVILDAWQVTSTATATPGTRTVSAGTDRSLLYWGSIRDTDGGTLTSVEYGGQAMTQVVAGTTNSGAGVQIHASLWLLDEAGIAAASDGNFAITRSNANGVTYRAFTASFEDVDQVNTVIASFAALGINTVDPVSQSILTGAAGITLAGIFGANHSGGTQDVTWTAPLVEEIEEVFTTTFYASIASAAGNGAQLTPTFDLINNSNSVLQAITLRHNVATSAVLLDDWTLISTSDAQAELGEEFLVSAGSNRLLVIAIGEKSANHPPVTVAFGGEAMTQVILAQTIGSFPLSVSLWVLDETGIAAAADSDVVVTFLGTHSGNFRMFAASYINVDEDAIVVNTYSAIANGTIAAPVVLDTAASGIAVAFIGNASVSTGPDVSWDGATERIEEVASASYFSIAVSPTDGTQKTITPSSSGMTFNALVAFSMRPAAQGGTLAVVGARGTVAITGETGNIVTGRISAVGSPTQVAITGEPAVLSGSIHRVRGSLDVVHNVRGEL